MHPFGRAARKLLTGNQAYPAAHADAQLDARTGRNHGAVGREGSIENAVFFDRVSCAPVRLHPRPRPDSVARSRRSRRRRADTERRAVPPHHVPGDGNVHYTDDFGDCRGTARATTRATTSWAPSSMHEARGQRRQRSRGSHADSSGTAGNMLILTGNDGWKYWYIHINNDTPGTDDGKNPRAVALRARHRTRRAR